MSTLALAISAGNAAWGLPHLLASAHAQAVPPDNILAAADAWTEVAVKGARKAPAGVLGTVAPDPSIRIDPFLQQVPVRAVAGYLLSKLRRGASHG